MNKRHMLLGVCILMFVFAANSVLAADCCVWGNEEGECGYIPYGTEFFCENAPIFLGLFEPNTKWITNYDSCDEINYTAEGIDSWCSDENSVGDLTIPEFGTIAATLALSGASMGYIYIRRKKR